MNVTLNHCGLLASAQLHLDVFITPRVLRAIYCQSFIARFKGSNAIGKSTQRTKQLLSVSRLLMKGAKTPDHPLVQSIYKNIIYFFNYIIIITRTQVIHEVNTSDQNTQDQHYLRHFQCVKILKLSENQKKAWMANTSRVCFVYSNIWSKCHLFSVKKGHNHPFPHDLHVLLCH